MEYAFGTSTSSPLASAACAGALGFPRDYGLRPPDRAIHDRSPLSLPPTQHGPEFFDREYAEQLAFLYGTWLLTPVAIVIHPDIIETATLVPAIGICPTADSSQSTADWMVEFKTIQASPFVANRQMKRNRH